MDDELSLKRKIIAFIVTLIAIPVVFIGTCVPVGIFAETITFGTYTLIAVIAYVAIFLAIAIRIAIRTKNPGIRWGIVVALIAAVIAAGLWFVPNVADIHVVN